MLLVVVDKVCKIFNNIFQFFYAQIPPYCTTCASREQTHLCKNMGCIKASFWPFAFEMLGLLRDEPLEKWWGEGGGGDFLRGNIYIFCIPIEEIIFFSRLMAGNFFSSEIYRLIFPARNFFFALCLGRFFFLIFFWE
jgi:hypothetical protein